MEKYKQPCMLHKKTWIDTKIAAIEKNRKAWFSKAGAEKNTVATPKLQNKAYSFISLIMKMTMKSSALKAYHLIT